MFSGIYRDVIILLKVACSLWPGLPGFVKLASYSSRIPLSYDLTVMASLLVNLVQFFSFSSVRHLELRLQGVQFVLVLFVSENVLLYQGQGLILSQFFMSQFPLVVCSYSAPWRVAQYLQHLEDPLNPYDAYSMLNWIKSFRGISNYNSLVDVEV